MERAFGASLRGVRLHTDPLAQQLNQSLNARATTVGRDIHFAEGEYDPESTAGRELLAHELTHILQQRHGGARVQRKGGLGKLLKKKKKGKPLLGTSTTDSDEGESSQDENDFSISAPEPTSSSSSSASSALTPEESSLPSSSTAEPSASSSSASSTVADFEEDGAVTVSNSMANDLNRRAMTLKEMADTAREMIDLHQNYKRNKKYIQSKFSRGLNMVLNVCDRILSVLEKVDPSGVTAVVHASLGLLRKLGDLAEEAYLIFSKEKDPHLREQLQSLLGPQVNIVDLIKESLDLGKAIKAVAETAAKVA
jgi:hypothetical protein